MWAALAAGVVALVLAGCTGDDPARPAAASTDPSGHSTASTQSSRPPRRSAVALTVANGGPPGSLVGVGRGRVVVEYPLSVDTTGWFVLLDTTADVMGPLRSATPSDAALAVGFGADLVTASTTGAVVDQLAQSDLSVVEEHTAPATLVRDPARRAPFNLYAVPDAVREAVGRREIGPVWPPGGASGVEVEGDGRAQDEVVVPVTSEMAVTWTWEPTAGEWLRTAGGRLEQSATGERITADSVLILEVEVGAGEDGGGEGERQRAAGGDAGGEGERQRAAGGDAGGEGERAVADRVPVVADLVGSGPARMLRRGRVLAARWERSGDTALPTVHGFGGVPAGATTWVHVCASPCT